MESFLPIFHSFSGLRNNSVICIIKSAPGNAKEYLLEWKTAVEIRKTKSSQRNHESGNELQVRKMNKDIDDQHG